jgi:gamma-glutamyltranspeptidase / glutathione hydrolase
VTSGLNKTTLLMAAAAMSLASCRPASAPSPVAPMSGKRVEGSKGMVAASHPDAAAAGAAVLAQGGNAVDAFVATAFALSVTDVSQTGLGGGGAMTYFNAATNTVEHLSFYPRTGSDAACDGACRGGAGNGRRLAGGAR